MKQDNDIIQWKRTTDECVSCGHSIWSHVKQQFTCLVSRWVSIVFNEHTKIIIELARTPLNEKSWLDVIFVFARTNVPILCHTYLLDWKPLLLILFHLWYCDHPIYVYSITTYDVRCGLSIRRRKYAEFPVCHRLAMETKSPSAHSKLLLQLYVHLSFSNVESNAWLSRTLDNYAVIETCWYFVTIFLWVVVFLLSNFLMITQLTEGKHIVEYLFRSTLTVLRDECLV